MVSWSSASRVWSLSQYQTSLTFYTSQTLLVYSFQCERQSWLQQIFKMSVRLSRSSSVSSCCVPEAVTRTLIVRQVLLSSSQLVTLVNFLLWFEHKKTGYDLTSQSEEVGQKRHIKWAVWCQNKNRDQVDSNLSQKKHQITSSLFLNSSNSQSRGDKELRVQNAVLLSAFQTSLATTWNQFK